MVTVRVLGALRIEISDREHFGFKSGIESVNFGLSAAYSLCSGRRVLEAELLVPKLVLVHGDADSVGTRCRRLSL
jgi:hypothetical protein